MKRQNPTAGNQGIVGNVNASVVAVGSGATAIQTGRSTDGPALSEAIGELRKAIDALALKPPAREALAGDLDALEKAGKNAAPKPDHIGGILQSLSGKLRMVGVALTETTALAEPLGKIAAALRVTLSFLGIG
jgi:hypothetical protein